MIVGIQSGATSGVAVYEDGKIIYAVSEERFTKEKNDTDWPICALREAKRVCNLSGENIEQVVLPTRKMTPMHFLCDISSYSIQDYIYEQKKYWGPVLLEGGGKNYLEVFKHKCQNTQHKDLYQEVMNAPSDEWPLIWNQWRIKKVCEEFDITEDKVTIVNHEYAHAAYAFYGSLFKAYEDVMCVVYDGYGDDSNASVYVFENGRIQQVSSYTNYNIGRVYRYITLLLGMKPDEHEYKVMGLAPYANMYIYEQPLKVFRKAYQFVDGKVVVDPELKDNYFYFRERLEGMRFDGIAAAVQIFTEEMNKKLVEYWCGQTGKSKLLISGGVALNIKANMEIGKLDCIKDLFVVGSSGDESLCIGSIYEWLDKQGRGDEILPLEDLYLGDDILEDEVENLINVIEEKGEYLVFRNPSVTEVASKLADGLILGRVSGKMEFGARALGNRSIIADPSKRETIDKINKKIKSRDFWMPFTPSILAEDEEEYLNNKKQFRFPFMSVACDTTQKAKEELKAAIHPADFTARPQLVTREMNEGYYELIKAFKKITGIGALLNTSLNVHGYPIARTAEDALWVMQNSDLDGLVFDKCMILRKDCGSYL